MIRSVKLTNKYSNPMKIYDLEYFQREYTNIVNDIINHIWNNGYENKNRSKFNADKHKYQLDTNLDNTFLKQFDYGIFTMRMLQSCGTQASSIIRSCTTKNKQRKYVMSSLMKQGIKCIGLQRATDKENISIPNPELLQPQIDNRFFDIEYIKDSNFDGFIQLRLFKNKLPIRIPFRKHKKFLEFETKGKLLKSLRIGLDYISLSFELPNKEKRSEGTKLGADQGIITTLTLSDGQTTIKNNHGYDLNSIIKILNRRIKGSKGFLRTQQHRENYVNWSINNLNLDLVKQINLEKLFQIRKGNNTSQFLSRFTYTLIKKKLLSRSETEGFDVLEVSNEFRSQRCSNCSWTQKSNRKGKVFICKSCSFATDADFNASLNLKEDGLSPVPKWVRIDKINRLGFFWNFNGLFDSYREPIVPHVQKL